LNLAPLAETYPLEAIQSRFGSDGIRTEAASLSDAFSEAVMTDWHDTMVDRPETDGTVYVTGWTISGLAVLGTIVAVWVLGI
jgi:hypothetical protein